MRVCIDGIPQPLRGRGMKRRIREHLEKTFAASGRVIEVKCRAHTKEGEYPLLIVVDGTNEPKLCVASAVAEACYEHSTQNGWWYRGFYIDHLLKE